MSVWEGLFRVKNMVRDRYANRFQEIFGFEISSVWQDGSVSYMDLKKELELEIPEGKTLHDVIIKQYGKEAAELLDRIEEESDAAELVPLR